jgi:hypothetical protein
VPLPRDHQHRKLASRTPTTATMSISSTNLSFPKPTLSPILGKPNNASLALLQQELYENARAIHSNRGGGLNGYLALVMPAAAYLERTNVAFVAPAIPPAVVHAVGATGAQIVEANRAFDKAEVEFLTYVKVVQELKQQIVAAVDPLYLSVLKDRNWGFSDVTPAAMLAHLKDTYGENTQFAREQNRNRLSEEWNPDDPIENLWTRIADVRTYATAAGQPIDEAEAIELTLAVLERTGVFTTAYDDWRKLDEATWTLALFMTTFTAANTERVRRLTIRTAGFHGANAAVPATPSRQTASMIQQPVITSPGAGGTVIYYCWSHGYSKNAAHTSATCNNKREGHKNDANSEDRKGGNERMGVGRSSKRPTTHQAAATAGPENDA